MMTWRNVLAGALALGLALGAVPGQAPAQTATTVGQTAIATGAPTLAGSPVSSRADLAAAFATKADIASPAFSGVATFQDVTINGTLRGASGFLPLGGGVLTGGLSGTAASFSGALSGGTVTASGNATIGGTLGVTNNATVGGTFGVTGFTTIGSNTNGNTFLFFNGASTSQKGIRWETAGIERWRLSVLNAETGINNGGQDFNIQKFTDAGAGSVVATIFRSTGQLIYNAYATFSYNTALNNEPNPSLVAQTIKSGGRGGIVGGRFVALNTGYVYTAVPDWVTATAYTTGTAVLTSGYNILVATSSGTSGGVTPTCSSTVPTCSDGGVSWAYETTRAVSYQLVGGTSRGAVGIGFGGTATGFVGRAYGFNPVCTVSVQFTLGCIGSELDVGIAFPGSQRLGEQIIATLAGQGINDDVAWRAGALTGTPGWKHMFDWGARNAAIAIDPNGYGLRAWSATTNDPLNVVPTNMIAAGALDLTEFQPTGVGEFGGGFILRGPGSQILGSGDFQSNFALLHQTATGASLDVSQYHVTGVAVHAGGGGTLWTGGLLADCTDGTVVQITSVSGGAVTGIGVWIGAYGNAPIATVTCTSEQLTGPKDDAGNATLPDTIQVDETWALANTGAPILALGGVASVTAPTLAISDNSQMVATTAYVQGRVSASIAAGAYAPLASPTFTGAPLAPTAAPGTNTTQLATTAFSAAAITVETSRATTAEALLAPKASPTFTGTVTIPGGASISGFAPLASPTFTGTVNAAASNFAGTVNVGSNATTQALNINGPAGIGRVLVWQTAGVKRWQLYGNAAAEGGANAGTDFVVTAYDDTGVALTNPLTITRSTGTIAFGTPVRFNGSSVVANGAIATTVTSLGPTGSHTTIQEWLTVQNASGTTRYIPLY